MTEFLMTAKIVHIRLGQKQVEKIELLASKMQMNQSAIFRRLIDAAEVAPAQFSANLSDLRGEKRGNA